MFSPFVSTVSIVVNLCLSLSSKVKLFVLGVSNLFCFTLGYSENFGYFVVNGVFLFCCASSIVFLRVHCGGFGCFFCLALVFGVASYFGFFSFLIASAMSGA